VFAPYRLRRIRPLLLSPEGLAKLIRNEKSGRDKPLPYERLSPAKISFDFVLSLL